MKKYTREEIEGMFKWVFGQHFFVQEGDSLCQEMLDDTFERLEKERQEKWVPAEGERYYHPSYVRGRWKVGSDINYQYPCDKVAFECGVYFKTKEECQKWINIKAPEVTL